MPYDTFSSKFKLMCGPVYYSEFDEFLNNVSPEEWAEWEKNAAELEVTVDYYVAEFV